MATSSARRRPIREGAARSNEPTCRISHFPSAPMEQSFHKTGRSLENGPARPTSRDAWENSNARVVGTTIRSGFIAVIDPAADKIFFRKSTRTISYFGANPNVRSNRLM
jgi:hypothetical protein